MRRITRYTFKNPANEPKIKNIIKPKGFVPRYLSTKIPYKNTTNIIKNNIDNNSLYNKNMTNISKVVCNPAFKYQDEIIYYNQNFDFKKKHNWNYEW